MKQCYNWNTNILNFKTKNSVEFRLEFKGDKTIVNGESSTGKTFLCTLIKQMINDKNPDGMKIYDVCNIFIATSDNIDKLFEQNNKLVIIDRSEMLLKEKEINFINDDTDNNRYLLFLRKQIGIELSPNYFADFVKTNDTIELKYQFDVMGWN